MPFPSPLAVVFDLDGTLVDSRDDIATACNHALVAHGRAALPVDVVRRFVGDGARLLVARAFELAASDPALDAPLATFRAYYEAHPADTTTLLPGARDVLDALRARGVKLAIATNKPRGVTERALDALDLRARVDALAAGGDGPLKPHPFTVRSVLEAVGVEPGCAWMVGDGPQDVRAGRAAGAFTIALRGGFAEPSKLAASKPDAFVDALAELLEPGDGLTADRPPRASPRSP
jgi:phosphoglycolate phosphatase